MRQITTLKNNFLDVIINEAKQGKSLRIISPFIKYTVVNKIVSSLPDIKLQVVTRYNLQDFYEGVSDTLALRCLLDNKAEIKGIRRLHTKLYLFDNGKVILSSANLTEGGMRKNHEFGVLLDNADAFRECESYFDYLWQATDNTLTKEMLNEWQDRIDSIKETRKPSKPNPLEDCGADVKDENAAGGGQNPPLTKKPQYFVKFFGISSDKADPEFSIYQEIINAGCHHAVCYSNGKNKAPRQVNDGDVIFMARMINPDEYAVFGVGRALAYDDERDNATPEEIGKYKYRNRWGRYIRVYDPIFLNGRMKDCPSFCEMMRELDYRSLTSTHRNYLKGNGGNINPNQSIMQKSAIQITEEGAEWLYKRFQEKLDVLGSVPDSKLIELPSSIKLDSYIPEADNVPFYPQVKQQALRRSY